jgi:tetratricopeptide (TPR) repeat protein
MSPSAIGRDTSPMNAENTLEMSNPQQDSKFQQFQKVAPNDYAKKIKLGEDFLKTYKDSPYRQPIFATLAVVYIQAGEPEKGYAAGANAVELNPNDIRTMAVLCQTMARLYNPSAPDAEKTLASAEQYGNQAVKVAPTLQKPATVSNQDFEAARTNSLAMAYSGLGLVSLRKGNYAQAIPDLDKAVSMDPKHDPTNYYLLGVANQNSMHYDAAIAGFTHCASLPGNLQETCKTAAEKAKKDAGPATPTSK